MRTYILAAAFISLFLAGCMKEPDYTDKYKPPHIFGDKTKNKTLPPGAEYKYALCDEGGENNCNKLTSSYDYYCSLRYYDPPELIGKCVKRALENCSSDYECDISDRCLANKCVYAEVKLPPDTPLETDKPQEEPPIMLSCEKDSDCPDWQYVRYRCKDIFKYGKTCVAVRSGAISGKTPGRTNDR